MKKAKLVQAFFTQEEIAAINTKNIKLEEENKKIKADYIKLSKIVETTWWYKASYVNELRDKIAKLEFDIDAWKKLKTVREDKERILNEEIRGLRDKKYSHWEPVVSSWPCFVGWNIS